MKKDDSGEGVRIISEELEGEERRLVKVNNFFEGNNQMMNSERASTGTNSVNFNDKMQLAKILEQLQNIVKARGKQPLPKDFKGLQGGDESGLPKWFK